MKTTLLKMSRKLWTIESVSNELNRINQLKWARAVHALGDRWLFAETIRHDSKIKSADMPNMRFNNECSGNTRKYPQARVF